MTTSPNDNRAGQDGLPNGTPSDEEAFDAALAEIEAAESADTPATPAAETGAELANDSQGAEAGATPATPTPGNAADQTQPASKDSTSPDAQSQDDVWANAPPELREAHERDLRDADFRRRSAASRQSAADRQIAELRAQIQQLQQGSTKPQAETQQGNQGEDSGQKPNDREARLAQLREDYPDVAEPILEELADLRATVGKLTQTAGTFEQQQVQQFVAEQEKILATQHPDWGDFAKPESEGGHWERFEGWLTTQPRSIQEAFARNARGIVDGNDAALVISRFKADAGIGTQAGKSAPTEAQAAQALQEERRARQLQGNRDTGRPNGPAAQTGFDQNDFDGVIAALADEYDKLSA